MAQKTVVEVLDDIDGTPADRTITFGLGGQEFEIDLNAKHADQLARALEPFIAKGRKIRKGTGRQTRSSSTPRSRADLAEIRQWAKTQPGLKVSDRGPVPETVFKAFDTAH